MCEQAHNAQRLAVLLAGRGREAALTGIMEK